MASSSRGFEKGFEPRRGSFENRNKPGWGGSEDERLGWRHGGGRRSVGEVRKQGGAPCRNLPGRGGCQNRSLGWRSESGGRGGFRTQKYGGFLHELELFDASCQYPSEEPEEEALKSEWEIELNLSTPNNWSKLLKQNFPLKPADVTFFVGPHREVIVCHKSAVSEISPSLKSLFDENKDKNEFELPGVDAQSFVFMVQFAYLRELPGSTMSESYLIEIFRVAYEFKCSILWKNCRQNLESRLNTNNVISIFLFADGLQVDGLRSKAKSELLRNFGVVSKSRDFHELSEKVLLELTQSELLIMESEVDVFQSLIKWAECVCKKQGSDASPGLLRNQLGRLLPQVRFAAMTVQEFLLRVEPSKIFSDNEVIAWVKYISKAPMNRNEEMLLEEFTKLGPRRGVPGVELPDLKRILLHNSTGRSGVL